MDEQESVVVRVRVPKGVVDFLREFAKVDVQEWLEDSLLHQFGADLNAFYGDSSVFMDLEALIEKFRLREVPILADGYIPKDC